ncbi:MAG: FAD/NAD(P)-binding protein [Beijerinckiaceae bacterium]
MCHVPVKHVIIIGGGASGVLMAAHLLRTNRDDLRVTLIERSVMLGRGLAYATPDRAHLLNVRATNMSAFADEPDHFWHWLVRQGAAPSCERPDRFCFVPRAFYGLYLESLLEPYRLRNGSEGCFVRIFGEAQSVDASSETIAVALADGSVLSGDLLILACGHGEYASDTVDSGNSALYESAWQMPPASPLPENAAAGGLSPDATVLILGTALTMVDSVLTLLDEGHRGKILALSRRGLLPQVHGAVEAAKFDSADLPFGTSLTYFCRWLRAQVRCEAARGGDWRAVVDAIRPYSQTLWRHLPLDSRARFLRHALPWWSSHRHRMAPQVDERLKAAMARGQLEVVAAKILRAVPDGSGARVTYRRRGATRSESLEAARIIDCTGLQRDPTATRNPILKSLLDCGLARPDSLRIGLDVDANCALIDKAGRTSSNIFAIGPLTQAAFWEIIAIPDIRVQVAQLAASRLAPPKDDAGKRQRRR